MFILLGSQVRFLELWCLQDSCKRVYDIVFEEDYETEETTTQNFSLVGDEIIAVYTATGSKRKYCEVFDRVPRKLKKLSSLLNVSLFKFDYYARFKDINESVE